MKQKVDLYPTPNTASLHFKAQEYAKKIESGEVASPTAQAPEERDAEFWKKFCEYVYGSYSSGNAHIRNGGYLSSGRTIHELRSYSRGEQAINKYKKIIDFRSDSGERRELSNISWENTRLFPRFRNQSLDRVGQAKHKPGLRAMDTAAEEERLSLYYKDRLLADPRMKQLTATAGVAAPSDTPMLSQMSQGDVDVLNTLGGYMLAQEMLVIDAVQASLGVSKWDDDLRDKIDQDLFDIGMASWMIYRDAGDGKFLTRYVDPVGVIVPYSVHDDFRDNQYRGVVERRTVASLRNQFAEFQGPEGEELLLKAAKQYSGYSTNPQWSSNFDKSNNSAHRGSFSANKGTRYDEFCVEVMTVYMRALDVERYICGYHKNGNYMFDKVRSDYTLDARDISRGKELKDVPIQYMYRCQWIEGTNIVFDYGRDNTIARSGAAGAMEAEFPLQVYAINEPSMVDRCIPIIDEIEIATRKKRLSLASLPPGPGYMIDTKLMADSVKMGDDTYSILELLGIYFNTGFLYYESQAEFMSNMDGGANRPPIQPMPSSKLQELQAFIVEITSLMGQLRDTLGLNEVADGSANPTDLLNGVAKQMLGSANSALRGLFTAVRDIFLVTERVIAKKYQVAVLSGEINIKYVPGSRTVPKSIKLDKSIFDCDFYFTAESMPTQEDKQALVMMLQKLSQERRVSEDVFFTVMNMIQEGDVKKAQYLLSIQAAKAAEAERNMARENITMQAQANAQSAQAAEQARAQAEASIVQAKIQLERVVGEEARKTEELKHRLRMTELTTGNFQNAAISTLQPTKSLETA